jgi:hypothetical protein
MEHQKTFHSGLYLISSCLVALAICWFAIIIFKCFGHSGLTAIPIFCMACNIISVVVCIVALVFYVAFCLRVWRRRSAANWRLLAVGTILLVAAIGSALFCS